MSEQDPPNLNINHDYHKRREAMALLAVKKGGLLTFAGRLLIGVEMDGQIHLYDENDQFVGIDKVPPLTRARTLAIGPVLVREEPQEKH